MREREREREREIVVGVCCMFGWIVLFVSQVIKLFGRQNRETEETLRERERKREKKKPEQDCELDFNLTYFLAFFAFMCQACSQGNIRQREIMMQLGATLEERCFLFFHYYCATGLWVFFFSPNFLMLL